MINIEKADIIEEIRNINWYLVDSIMRDDKNAVKKNQILLQSLIKLYLKEEADV